MEGQSIKKKSGPSELRNVREGRRDTTGLQSVTSNLAKAEGQAGQAHSGGIQRLRHLRRRCDEARNYFQLRNSPDELSKKKKNLTASSSTTAAGENTIR